MAILQGDIKFLASKVMDDVPDGGGPPTGVEILDGVSNAMFADISEVDRTVGAVAIVKAFLAVQTDNVDTYLDANIIVAEPPADPNVSVTLYSDGDVFSIRDQARQRIEAYLGAGPEWPGFLLENHIANQSAIQIFQRPSERIPNNNETLVLVWNEGLANQRLQYVGVISTSVVIRTYTRSNGTTYEGAVITCELRNPLIQDMPGSSANEFFTRATTGTKIRETRVTNAAVFYGAAKLVQPASLNSLTAKVASVFTQLVPSAQTETPMVGFNAAAQAIALKQAGDGTIVYTTAQPFNSTTVVSVGNAITPGTLVITAGSASLTDTGGQLFDGAAVIGTVDYPRGTVSFTGVTAPYTGSKTVAFKAAGAPLVVADTGQIPVTPESRASNYVITVVPPPAPGALQVSFRALGRWYDLRDNGAGQLKGTDAANGAGNINYATGDILVTLGSLPDVGSSVMLSWGMRSNYIDRSALAVDKPALRFQLEHFPVRPGVLSIAWNDGAARTATDNGKGLLTGDASGTIDYNTGLGQLVLNNLPAGAQQFDITYSSIGADDVKAVDLPEPVRNGDTTVTFDLGETNITPGTVELEWPVVPLLPEVDAGRTKVVTSVGGFSKARDDGNGNLIDALGRVAGTIAYATGIGTFQPDGNVVALLQSFYNEPDSHVIYTQST